MFHLIGGIAPTTRTVLVKSSGNMEVEYIATRTREVINLLVDGEYEGSMYISRQTLDEITGYRTQVFGKWKEIEQFIGMNNGLYIEGFKVPQDKFGFEMEENSSRRANKVKGYTYHVIEQQMDLNLGTYNSIEEFLYRNRTLLDITNEQEIDLSWADEKDYRILTTVEEIDNFIEGLANTDEIVGFDTETSGLLVGCVKIDKLVGLSMSYEDDTGYYFPVDHKRIKNIDMTKEEFLQKLKPYIDANSPTAKPLVGHNIGFDWKVLKQDGIDLNVVHDTFLRLGVLDINQVDRNASLKGVVSDSLGIDVVELDDMYESISRREISAIKNAVFNQGLEVDELTKYKLSRIDFFKGRGATLPFDFRYASRDFVELYGSADADFPRIIYKLQEEQWDSTLDMIYRIEMETIRTIGEQEYWGIVIDEEALHVLHDESKAKLEVMEQEIYELAGEEFNINSSQQLGVILFDKLKYPYLQRFNTKGGDRGTSKGVLRYYAKQRTPSGEDMYPLASKLLAHSSLSTLISNFYGSLPKLIHGGRIFPNYKQLGTATGRVSSNNPNAQNIEPTVRSHMHVDDVDEYYMMICDYSQVEYRVMGGLSKEPNVVDFFIENPEADYHIQSYANMHRVPYESVTAEQREDGKTLNFGTTYGLEDENLANNLYGNTTELHQQLAREARTQYFEGIPTLRDYFEEIRDKAEIDGFATTLFGRRRNIPEFYGKDVSSISEYERASGRRKAGNLPVQGTAADIQKLAMYRIRQVFNQEGIAEEDAHLILNVHDEIAIHVHKKYHPYYILQLMRRAMEMDLSEHGIPPLYIGAIIGTNWGYGQDDDMEMPVVLMNEIVERVEKEGIKYNTDKTIQGLIDDWQDEINRFAIRQIQGEILTRELTTLEECHDVGRIKKYSGYFSNKDAIVKKVFESDDITYLQANYQSEIDSLGDYKFVPRVLQDVEEEDVTPLGERIPEDKDTLHSRIREHLYVNRINQDSTSATESERTVHIRLAYNDVDFLEIIESMLVGRDVYNEGIFKEGQEMLRLRIYFGNAPYVIKQRGVLSGMIKLLAYGMAVHLFGIGNYHTMSEKVEEIGTTLIKEKHLV